MKPAVDPDLPAPAVTAPEGYRRSTFFLRGNRTLTDADAAEMIGHEMSVSMGEHELGSGTVTDCRVVDDGARFKLTVESRGRGCAACGHIYPEGEALTALAQLGDVQDNILYGGLTNWVLVCADRVTCSRRRAKRLPPQPGA